MQPHTIRAPQIRPALHHKCAVNDAGDRISDFETYEAWLLSIPGIRWDVDRLFGRILRGPCCLVDGLSDHKAKVRQQKKTYF